MPLGQLEIDLWPAGLVLTIAACLIGVMLLVDRLACAGAVARTRRALNGSSVE